MWHLIVPAKSLAPLHARGVQGGHEFVDVVHDRIWTCFAGGAEVRLRAEMALHLTAHEPPALPRCQWLRPGRTSKPSAPP